MKNFLTAVFLTTFFCNAVLAQADTSLVARIERFVKQVDSINNLNDVQGMGFIQSIEEGTIRSNGQVVGGVGMYTLSNLKSDTVLRIEYHDNLDVNIYKTYYYLSNNLVYASIQLKDGTRNMKTLYSKKEFYNGDHIISTISYHNKDAEPFLYKTDFSSRENGLQFLESFKRKNSERNN